MILICISIAADICFRKKELKHILIGLLCVITVTGETIVPAAPAEPEEPAAPAYKTYTVKPGDTLWSIAKKFMGSGFRWGELFQLNADLVKNPRMIYVGQVLRVPA